MAVQIHIEHMLVTGVELKTLIIFQKIVQTRIDAKHVSVNNVMVIITVGIVVILIQLIVPLNVLIQNQKGLLLPEKVIFVQIVANHMEQVISFAVDAVNILNYIYLLKKLKKLKNILYYIFH
jgi:hypothetical protein